MAEPIQSTVERYCLQESAFNVEPCQSNSHCV